MVSTARIWSGVSRLWTYLKPQGAVPQGFNPSWRGLVYRLFRGMPMGSEAFLEPLGYGSAPRPTLKNPCAILVRLVRRRTNIVELFIDTPSEIETWASASFTTGCWSVHTYDVLQINLKLYTACLFISLVLITVHRKVQVCKERKSLSGSHIGKFKS